MRWVSQTICKANHWKKVSERRKIQKVLKKFLVLKIYKKKVRQLEKQKKY